MRYGWIIWLAMTLGALAADFVRHSEPVPWQQVKGQQSFTVFCDREAYDNLDPGGRFILAVQTGKDGPALEDLRVEWSVRLGEQRIEQRTTPIGSGMVDVSFALDALAPGRYDVEAQLYNGEEQIAADHAFFRVESVPEPPRSGRVPLRLPRPIPADAEAFPIQGGVPFPKGVLWRATDVRVLTGAGEEVPSQAIVRSRWGHHPESSIRWLGIDIQAVPGTDYVLEYGMDVEPATVARPLQLTDGDAGIAVDTGPLQFTVSRERFNLLSNLVVAGTVQPSDPQAGLYLIDQNGDTYRAANDRSVEVSIEEQGALRAVIRAAGWYVKDGTDGETQHYTLPTDKLCKFVTRLEVYAGKPYVRVLNTWILTADTFTVRFRDVGLIVPAAGREQVAFGVEDGDPVQALIAPGGTRLVQHLPDAFAVENGDGSELVAGRRSAGWLTATGAATALTISHRDTWQRFPKELEALPSELRLHIWPAHGRLHPEIDTTADDEIHKLWFAHQGEELDMRQPWETYFAVSQHIDDPSVGVYKGAGLALAGVHASGLGAAITSDMLLDFGGSASRQQAAAQVFQLGPQLLADPVWGCASEAFGWVHPYDPENFPTLEEIIQRLMRAHWQTQDDAGEFGMWLYRVWHHNSYLGDGKWHLYRLYNATHHYDAFMPWLMYARSGDPFYLTQGLANIRTLSDVQVIHYDDPSYPHQEFHFGQRRLVGSTRHTNGFNTWGGDHAVLAHLSCYNAMILAYYLTGDLRLREVVVDEWQQTLIADRAHPEFARADRSERTELNGARDNANAMGELLDLYQLTHEPAVLGQLEPKLRIFLDTHMRHWGQPLHNILLSYRSEQAREQLLAATEAHRTTMGKPTPEDDPHSLWYTHSPHENWALAAIQNPDAGYHIDAFFATNPGRWQARVRDVEDGKPRALVFCAIPDYLLYLPRVMYAIANSPDDFAREHLDASQTFPANDNSFGAWTRTIVQEATDHAWDIRILGKIGPDGMPLQVFGPDQTLIAETVVPPGMHNPWRLTMPEDQQSGQYVILVKARDNRDLIRAPLTELPEVYYVGYWAQEAPTRFFTRSLGDEPVTIGVQPHKHSGEIIGADQRPLTATETGEMMKAQIGPDGAWILTGSRYIHVENPVTIAVSPERWFAPSEAARQTRPKE